MTKAQMLEQLGKLKPGDKCPCCQGELKIAQGRGGGCYVFLTCSVKPVDHQLMLDPAVELPTYLAKIRRLRHRLIWSN